MKRSAAVTGPTPAFVRWAIEQRCPLRDCLPDDLRPGELPRVTFRQLRTLRALSDGIADGRVMDGICLHPMTVRDAEVDAESARGFFAEEVFDVYGLPESLESNCGGCSANARDQSGSAWAGCYGWLPVDPQWSLDGQESRQVPGNSLIEQTAEVFARFPELHSRIAKPTSPEWYGLWANAIPDREQLTAIDFTFSQLVENDANRECRSLIHFRDAVSRCLAQGLKLHVEFCPPGFSDGNRWTIEPSCVVCRAPAAVRKRCGYCPVCQQSAGISEARTAKVLGMRPFLRLSKLLGAGRAMELIRKHRLSED